MWIIAFQIIRTGGESIWVIGLVREDPMLINDQPVFDQTLAFRKLDSLERANDIKILEKI
jgi:hypothetical protein